MEDILTDFDESGKTDWDDVFIDFNAWFLAVSFYAIAVIFIYQILQGVPLTKLIGL